MNLILLEDVDFIDSSRVRLTDRRADHIRKILKPTPGQQLRVGRLNGPKGVGELSQLDDQQVVLDCQFESSPPLRPTVDLMMALPRPQSLERLWPQLTAVGVRTIYLTNANKVERFYFDSHTLQPERYLPRLKEGLEQAGDTWLPDVSIHKRLKVFLADSLPSDVDRFIADPGEQLQTPPPGSGKPRLLAIGPEGGWTDYERDLLSENGFKSLSLGPRVLRSDTACIVGLALLGA